MTVNCDITIFNMRIGEDRREVFFPTEISGVSWYGSKSSTSSGTGRSGSAAYTVRIPESATTESGKTYVGEDEYRRLSDDEAGSCWTIQKGDFVVKGMCAQEDIDTIEKLREYDGDFMFVTEYADNTVRGTAATRHWRIGGA